MKSETKMRIYKIIVKGADKIMCLNDIDAVLLETMLLLESGEVDIRILQESMDDEEFRKLPNFSGYGGNLDNIPLALS